ncbi:MAG: hypothetical protein WDN46_05705 [Methylocella sp.]
MERQRPISACMVERVARHASGGSWLDVDFGNGSLLFAAEEWGFVPVGLDLRGDNVETLKTLGRCDEFGVWGILARIFP